MSDLSNLLGDLYGDSSDADGPPVRHEPPAAERSDRSARSGDDDLAAALSAALAEPAPAPAMPAVPAVPPVAQPFTPAPAPVSAPVVPAAPVAPVAPRQSWTHGAAHDERVSVSVPSVEAGVSAPVHAAPRMWVRGDDDIAPAGPVKKRK